MKKLEIEEWEKIGELTKRINTDINELTVLASSGMPLTKTSSLRISSRYLNKFRSDAENLMFSKGLRNTNIFYGNQGAEE